MKLSERAIPIMGMPDYMCSPPPHEDYLDPAQMRAINLMIELFDLPGWSIGFHVESSLVPGLIHTFLLVGSVWFGFKNQVQYHRCIRVGDPDLYFPSVDRVIASAIHAITDERNYIVHAKIDRLSFLLGDIDLYKSLRRALAITELDRFAEGMEAYGQKVTKLQDAMARFAEAIPIDDPIVAIDPHGGEARLQAIMNSLERGGDAA